MFDRLSTYINSCHNLASKIREYGKSWIGVKEYYQEFERPLLTIINDKELGLEKRDIHFWVSYSQDDCLEAESASDVASRILRANNPLQYVENYKTMITYFLNSPAVTDLINIFNELDNTSRLIQESFDEILINESYREYACHLCKDSGK